MKLSLVVRILCSTTLTDDAIGLNQCAVGIVNKAFGSRFSSEDVQDKTRQISHKYPRTPYPTSDDFYGKLLPCHVVIASIEQLCIQSPDGARNETSSTK